MVMVVLVLMMTMAMVVALVIWVLIMTVMVVVVVVLVMMGGLRGHCLPVSLFYFLYARRHLLSDEKSVSYLDFL